MSEDPLGVILKARASPSTPKSESRTASENHTGFLTTRLDERLDDPGGRPKANSMDLLKGPKGAAPTLPIRSFREQQKEYATMDREIALFFADGTAPPPKKFQSSDFPESEDSVKRLIDAGRYRVAIRMCRQLIEENNKSDGDKIKLGHCIRSHLAVCHFRLGEYEEAREVVINGSDSNNNKTVPPPFSSFESQPFNLHVMRCELAHYLGDNDEAVRAFFQLRERITRDKEGTSSSSSSSKQTLKQLSIINEKIVSYLILGSKLRLALHIASKAAAAAKQSSLICAKILLKMGDVKRARKKVEEYAKEKSFPLSSSSSLKTNEKKEYSKERAQLTEMRALLLTADSRFEDAHKILSPLIDSGFASMDAINNYAICSLFTNKIAVAIQSLEECVREDPFQGLNMAIVQNLVSLYDLCSLRNRKAVIHTLFSSHHDRNLLCCISQRFYMYVNGIHTTRILY